MTLSGKCIVIGLSGGIACYKTAELVRLLVQDGALVRVIMTRGAQEFITPLTLQTLSGSPVSTNTFSLTQESQIGHIRLADSADAIVVAPATANIIGKLAAGIADDLLTTVLTATRAPVLLAPAMNVNMYQNSIVQENLDRLRAAGFQVVEPERGPLACGYEGVGRLCEPPIIVEELRTLLSVKDLAGERMLVTAGPNREPIDPVRFLSNRSTGRMGYAVARVARRRGAEVVLVTGPTALAPPAGVAVVEAVTAQDMHRAVMDAYAQVTTVVMTAAVADYRAEHVSQQKLKKGSGPVNLRLVRNPDILDALGRRKGQRLLVGFAAETDQIKARATRKLREKHLDLIVANDVSAADAGFESETNRVHLIDAHGQHDELPLLPKEEVAEQICAWLVAHRRHSRVRGPSPAKRRQRR
jgi:phosphopantothenoylcysteine decarboxylase/phosphopantothenate--cysteine ligase